MTKLILPLSMPSIVGVESNIYFENILQSWTKPAAFNWDVSVANNRVPATFNNGLQLSECWRMMPTVAESWPLTFSIGQNGTELSTATTTVSVRAKNTGTGNARKVCVLGDSITSSGGITGQLLSNAAAFGGLSVQLVGSQVIAGQPLNRHEGRSGKNSQWFANDPASPLMNAGSLDFANYLLTLGVTMNAGDHVFINLGTNDVFSATSESVLLTRIEQVVNSFNALIMAINNAELGVNVWVWTLPAYTTSQDAFGFNYAVNQNRDRCNYYAGRTRESVLQSFQNRSDVKIFPAHLCVDPWGGMPRQNYNTSAHDTTQIARQNNAVHPSSIGQKQLGDLMTACIWSTEN